MDSDVHLVILSTGGAPRGSASEGLGSELMSSLGINSTRKWMPLLAATRVVMVETITRPARTVAWE